VSLVRFSALCVLLALPATAQWGDGVLVESVRLGSVAARADVRPGDTLRAWRALAMPEGQQPAAGRFSSPFDLLAAAEV
jgi:hypothetical protein